MAGMSKSIQFKCSLGCLGLLVAMGCTHAPVDNDLGIKPPTESEQFAAVAVGRDREITLALDRYLFSLYKQLRGVSTTDSVGIAQVRKEAIELRKSGKLQWEINAVRQARTPHLFLWVGFNDPIQMQHVLLYSQRKRAIRRMQIEP